MKNTLYYMLFDQNLKSTEEILNVANNPETINKLGMKNLQDIFYVNTVGITHKIISDGKKFTDVEKPTPEEKYFFIIGNTRNTLKEYMTQGQADIFLVLPPGMENHMLQGFADSLDYKLEKIE